jgi:hypothetical protein
MTHTAAEVISQYARLTADWRQPKPMLTSYIHAFTGDVLRKRGHYAASIMFYPLFSNPAHDYERWAQLVGKDLFSARVYQVTEEMCRAVTAIYRKSAEKTTRISFDELPAECGFAWLDEPPELLDRWGKITRDRAVSWCVTAVPETDPEIASALCPGLRIMFWADVTVEDEYTLNWDPDVKRRSERQVGRLQMQHCYMMPLDTDMTFEGSSTGRADNVIMWMHALFMLLGTEIHTTRRASIPSSVKGNLKKRVKHPDVTVVALRRIAPRPAEAGTKHHVDVEWQYRWIVQGHHRHLEQYNGHAHTATPLLSERGTCAICRKRITWIHPHIKPNIEGLLMKPSSDVVYRLRR